MFYLELKYIKKNKNFDKIDFFLFPSLNNKFQKESLDLLKINQKKDYPVKIIDILKLIE